MKKLLSLILLPFCFIILSSCGTSKTVSLTAPVLQPSETGGSGIVYKVPGMDNVKVKKDVTYKEDRGEELKLDVYYPSGETDGRNSPTVVLIHGVDDSNPSIKDTGVYGSWGRVLGADGFSAVTFNWRPNESTSDVTDLINYIRKHSKKLKINGDNIKVIAFSMGTEEGLREIASVNTGFVKSIVVFYGMVDPRILITSETKLPPMFFAIGGEDTVIPADINDNFIKEAQEKGYSMIKVVHPSGGHGFDVYSDNDTTKDIIDKAISFLINDGVK